MQVILRPAAAADIEDAISWYWQQRPALGTQFLEAVNAVLESIAGNPRLAPIVHRNTRRALLRRFPYGIYYRIYPDIIVVVACMHGRRDPKRWRARR
jgi:plasmid stabilization system protein ParE